MKQQTFVVNYKAGLTEIFTIDKANTILGEATKVNSNNTEAIKLRDLVNYGLHNVISFGTITVEYGEDNIKYTDWNISVLFHNNDAELFDYCLRFGIDECMECIPCYEYLARYSLTGAKRYTPCIN